MPGYLIRFEVPFFVHACVLAFQVVMACSARELKTSFIEDDSAPKAVSRKPRSKEHHGKRQIKKKKGSPVKLLKGALYKANNFIKVYIQYISKVAFKTIIAIIISMFFRVLFFNVRLIQVSLISTRLNGSY